MPIDAMKNGTQAYQQTAACNDQAVSVSLSSHHFMYSTFFLLMNLIEFGYTEV